MSGYTAKWANSNAKSEALNLVNLFGKPSAFNANTGGLVLWNVGTLKNCKLFGMPCVLNSVIVVDNSVNTVTAAVRYVGNSNVPNQVSTLNNILQVAYNTQGQLLSATRTDFQWALNVLSYVAQGLSINSLGSIPQDIIIQNASNDQATSQALYGKLYQVYVGTKPSGQERMIADPWYSAGGRVHASTSKYEGDILDYDEDSLVYYNTVTPPAQRDQVLIASKLERLQNSTKVKPSLYHTPMTHARPTINQLANNSSSVKSYAPIGGF